MRFKTSVPIYDWADLTVGIKEILIGEDGSLERGHYRRDQQHCFIDFDIHRIHHGCIAHEAGHAAWDILSVSGVKVTCANDEAKAYLKDWIVRWIEYRLTKAGIMVPSPKTFNGHKGMPKTKRVPKFK